MTTATALTNRLLLAIPHEITGARAWRSNQGGAYPAAVVQAAIGALATGDIKRALHILRTGRMVMFGLPGLPDIDGWMPDGRRLGIEVKVGKDKLRPEQQVVQALYRKAGCIYVVATDEPAGGDPVRACIEEIKQRGIRP